MTEKELMKLAKRRVVLKATYKWMWVGYSMLTLFLVFIWAITGRGYFWPIWPMIGNGFALAVIGVVFYGVLSGGSADKITAEYNRLRHAYPGLPKDEFADTRDGNGN